MWSTGEYDKLPRYDGDIPEQTADAVFMCHQPTSNATEVCSGWLGHRDPSELLAVRLGVLRGDLDSDSLEYRTDVPLFESGADAAAHGLANDGVPGAAGRAVIDKIIRLRKGD